MAQIFSPINFLATSLQKQKKEMVLTGDTALPKYSHWSLHSFEVIPKRLRNSVPSLCLGGAVAIACIVAWKRTKSITYKPTSQPAIKDKPKPKVVKQLKPKTSHKSFVLPPQGFYWRTVTPLKTMFLVPDGWYYKQFNIQGQFSFTIARENVEVTGVYTTGFCLKYFVASIVPEKQKAIIKRIIDDSCLGAFVEKQPETVKEGFQYEWRTRHEVDKFTFVKHSVLLCFQNGDMVLMWFEAPAEQWNDLWVIGQQLLRTQQPSLTAANTLHFTHQLEE